MCSCHCAESIIIIQFMTLCIIILDIPMPMIKSTLLEDDDSEMLV